MIVFDCSHCGKPLSAKDEQANREIECFECGQQTAVPLVSAIEKTLTLAEIKALRQRAAEKK